MDPIGEANGLRLLQDAICRSAGVVTANARLTFNGFLAERRIVRTDLTDHGGNFHIRHPCGNSVHAFGSSPFILIQAPEAMDLNIDAPTCTRMRIR
jgi:hypothetical protein